jgi:hypothetical protein
MKKTLLLKEVKKKTVRQENSDKGTYKLSYLLNKEPKELLLVVELRQTEGFYKPYRNVWEGFATLNGQPYTEEDLSHCVDAKLAAQRIGNDLKNKIKTDAKENGIKFKINKE